jgi:hypothetical protein
VMVDGPLPRLCLPWLRGPHRHLRLAHDERAALRPVWPTGLREPLPPHTRPPDPEDVRLATAGEADGRGPRRGPRLALPRLASPAASGNTRRARGRPSGAARPRWRAAAGAARRPLRELQRAEGSESAAALSVGCPGVDDTWPTATTSYLASVALVRSCWPAVVSHARISSAWSIKVEKCPPSSTMLRVAPGMVS